MRHLSQVARPSLWFPALLAMVLAACGGGRGDPGPTAALTGLSISGPSTVNEYAPASYTATAGWDDDTTSTVTPAWSVDAQEATIDSVGRFSCSQIDADRTVTVTATFSAGGITETATMDVIVTDVEPIPFTTDMVVGKAYFEEVPASATTVLSRLVRFGADSSFDEVSRRLPSGGTTRVAGTWSIDASGRLVLSVSGSAPAAWTLLADDPGGINVFAEGGGDAPSAGFLEKTVAVDPALLPGTYTQAGEGYTWVFNANGTGTCSIFGGLAFSWSVDSAGVLRTPASNGYVPWLYARAATQSSPSGYTVLRVAFAEYAPNGALFSYYGGKDLTRQ